MFHQWDVYYFRDLIGRGMNWTCFEYDCDINVVLGKLRDCDKLSDEASAYVDNTWRTGPSTVSCWLSRAHMNCYSTVLRTLCGNQKDALNDHRLAKYSAKVRQRVLRSCKKQNETTCDERELHKNLSTCDGIVDTFIVPYSKDFSDLGKMATACTNVKRFQKCVHKTAPKECFEPGGIELVTTQKYFREYYYQYNWICRVVEARPSGPECSKAHLIDRLPECSGFVMGRLFGTTEAYIEEKDLDTYMRYQRDYEVCVSMVIRDVCGSTEYAQEDSLEVVKFTRDYLKLGAFLRESVSSRADPRCFRNYVNKKLKECEGLIVAFPSPQLSKSYHGAQLEESCRTLQDYVFCANMKLNKVCGSLRNNQVTTEARKVIAEKYDNHSWVCRIKQVAEKGCTKQGIVSKLKQCVGFLFVHVVKHATDYDVYNDDTCKYVQEYQQCVADMLNTSCSRQAVLMKLDDIKYYTSHLYSKYEHLCRSAPFCEEAVLVKNLSQCTGYITVNVLPHLKKTSDRSRLNLACNGLKGFQRCVKMTIPGECKGSKVMYSSSVLYYTKDLYQKYSWTCDATAKNQLCNTEALHKRLPMCSGFITHKAAVNAVSKTDRRSLKLACSAVMDYQRCVQGIVSEVCQDRQYMPETTDVKHYTRDLYFKYYWTCQPDSSQGDPSRVAVEAAFGSDVAVVSTGIILLQEKSATNPSLKMLCTVAKASY
ncbi:uncharacterized protein LOC142775096 [Rhipicephalus microplus]|uniref:uncharacterized protein LOC142775096 n=1 Tax=Rhipicephalus microplus TaxID=6941 RepID=UPI003F6D323D